MARGRRPLPTAVKDLRGNPGKRPRNLNEPQIEVGDPEMPAGLSDAAKQEWDAMVPHLKKMGVLTPVDRSALAGCPDRGHCLGDTDQFRVRSARVSRRGAPAGDLGPQASVQTHQLAASRVVISP